MTPIDLDEFQDKYSKDYIESRRLDLRTVHVIDKLVNLAQVAPRFHDHPFEPKCPMCQALRPFIKEQ